MKLKLTFESNGLKIEGVTETQNDICEFAKQCKIACGEFITKDLLKSTQPERKIRVATDKQKALLNKLNIEYNENITAQDASDLIDQHYGNKSSDELNNSEKKGKSSKPASEKQIQLLVNLGANIPDNLTSAEASNLIDKIKSIK